MPNARLSFRDGPGVEAIGIGRACGRLLAVTVTEKSSVMIVLDIRWIAPPYRPALASHMVIAPSHICTPPPRAPPPSPRVTPPPRVPSATCYPPRHVSPPHISRISRAYLAHICPSVIRHTRHS